MEGDDDYDFSEYTFDNPLYNKKNKKVIGKMKDELSGMILEQFIGFDQNVTAYFLMVSLKTTCWLIWNNIKTKKPKVQRKV